MSDWAAAGFWPDPLACKVNKPLSGCLSSLPQTHQMSLGARDAHTLFTETLFRAQGQLLI